MPGAGGHPRNTEDGVRRVVGLTGHAGLGACWKNKGHSEQAAIFTPIQRKFAPCFCSEFSAVQNDFQPSITLNITHSAGMIPAAISVGICGFAACCNTLDFCLLMGLILQFAAADTESIENNFDDDGTADTRDETPTLAACSPISMAPSAHLNNGIPMGPR